jgi:hypothetical protein
MSVGYAKRTIFLSIAKANELSAARSPLMKPLIF